LKPVGVWLDTQALHREIPNMPNAGGNIPTAAQNCLDLLDLVWAFHDHQVHAVASCPDMFREDYATVVYVGLFSL
jgi:hypothetical protein